MKVFTRQASAREVARRLVGTTIFFLMFFVLPAPGEFASRAFSDPIQLRQGTIEGKVVDSSGTPVPNATVYLLQNGRTPATVTNAQGNFVLRNVRVGTHRVFAYKESENYPNPVWSFYSDANGLEGFPVVEVRSGEVSGGLLVSLPPKAGRLKIQVTDEITKRPISNASISVNHHGKPTTAFQPGATGLNGELTVLIPVGVPISLRVTAAGYLTWNYRNGDSKPPDAIQLKTAENKSFRIELTKASP